MIMYLSMTDIYIAMARSMRGGAISQSFLCRNQSHLSFLLLFVLKFCTEAAVDVVVLMVAVDAEVDADAVEEGMLLLL